jgi:hypothetical protein
LIDKCKERARKAKVLLLLTSYGGDAHAAYRIARCLVQNYHDEKADSAKTGEVIIFVNSVCASAGTLITLAADRLILGDHAQLGPLDVQLRKPDEVGERTSGLTPIQALKFLEGETTKFFRAQFRALRFQGMLPFSSETLSTEMAADTSAKLASGLLAKLYEQIDPLRLAEYDRKNKIAEHYGDRIKSKNVKAGTVTQLLEAYPSHECCIDPVEAKELFERIERPQKNLEALGELLKPIAVKYNETDQTCVFYLVGPKKPTESDKSNEEKAPNTANPGTGGEVAGNAKAEGRPKPQEAHARRTA